MATCDYIVGQPFEYDKNKLDAILSDTTALVAEEQQISNQEAEPIAYRKLANYYNKIRQDHFNALCWIGAGVEEFLDSPWYTGMDQLIQNLEEQATRLEQQYE